MRTPRTECDRYGKHILELNTRKGVGQLTFGHSIACAMRPRGHGCLRHFPFPGSPRVCSERLKIIRITTDTTAARASFCRVSCYIITHTT